MPLKTANSVGIVLLAFLSANSRESYKTHSNLPGIAANGVAVHKKSKCASNISKFKQSNNRGNKLK